MNMSFQGDGLFVVAQCRESRLQEKGLPQTQELCLFVISGMPSVSPPVGTGIF